MKITDGEKTLYLNERGEHRVFGPAVTFRTGTNAGSKSYFRNGVRSRIFGPSVVNYSNGALASIEWRKDDLLHRIGGPAVQQFSEGKVIYEAHYRKGKLHNDYGPAVISYGDEVWYRNGEVVDCQTITTKMRLMSFFHRLTFGLFAW